MTLNKILNQLHADGWYLKLAPGQKGPEKCWRVWLAWRQGDLPHKEESARLGNLTDVATWLENTADQWRFDDDG